MDLLTSFKMLDVSANAGFAEVKQAYRIQVRQWHPDLFPEGSILKVRAEERLKQINAAYGRIQKHLLSQMPPDPVSDESPPSSPKRSEAEPAGTVSSEKKSGRAAWLNHLLDVWATLTGDGTGSGAETRVKEESGGHRRNFKQILAEMTDGDLFSSKGESAGSPPFTGSPGSPVSRYRHYSGCTGSDPVESVRPVDPVRPVHRIRGIGRN